MQSGDINKVIPVDKTSVTKLAGVVLATVYGASDCTDSEKELSLSDNVFRRVCKNFSAGLENT